MRLKKQTSNLHYPDMIKTMNELQNIDINITILNNKMDNINIVRSNINKHIISNDLYTKPQNFDSQDHAFTNHIYNFIGQRIRRKFVKSEAYKLLLADYQEISSPFTLSFSIVVIGTIPNYEIFIENLKKFIYELNDVFNTSPFQAETSYKENFIAQIVQQKSKKVEEVKSEDFKDKLLKDLPKKASFLTSLPATITLFFSLGLSIVGIFDDQIFNDKPSEVSKAQNEKYIEHQIQEEKEKNLYKEYDLLIDQELQKTDSKKNPKRKEFIQKLKHQFLKQQKLIK